MAENNNKPQVRVASIEVLRMGGAILFTGLEKGSFPLSVAVVFLGLCYIYLKSLQRKRNL